MEMSNENLSHCVPIGIAKIDRQHLEFVKIINDFHGEIVSDHGVEVLENVFDSLFDYARLHFRDEEILMRKHNYPGLADHKSEHQLLLEELEKQTNACLGVDHPHPEIVLQFLRKWLIEHVNDLDVEMGKFLVLKGEC